MTKVELANRLLKELKIDCFDEEGYVHDETIDPLISLISEYIAALKGAKG